MWARRDGAEGDFGGGQAAQLDLEADGPAVAQSVGMCFQLITLSLRYVVWEALFKSDEDAPPVKIAVRIQERMHQDSKACHEFLFLPLLSGRLCRPHLLS